MWSAFGLSYQERLLDSADPIELVNFQLELGIDFDDWWLEPPLDLCEKLLLPLRVEVVFLDKGFIFHKLLEYFQGLLVVLVDGPNYGFQHLSYGDFDMPRDGSGDTLDSLSFCIFISLVYNFTLVHLLLREIDIS